MYVYDVCVFECMCVVILTIQAYMVPGIKLRLPRQEDYLMSYLTSPFLVTAESQGYSQD